MSAFKIAELAAAKISLEQLTFTATDEQKALYRQAHALVSAQLDAALAEYVNANAEKEAANG